MEHEQYHWVIWLALLFVVMVDIPLGNAALGAEVLHVSDMLELEPPYDLLLFNGGDGRENPVDKVHMAAAVLADRRDEEHGAFAGNSRPVKRPVLDYLEYELERRLYKGHRIWRCIQGGVSIYRGPRRLCRRMLSALSTSAPLGGYERIGFHPHHRLHGHYGLIHFNCMALRNSVKYGVQKIDRVDIYMPASQPPYGLSGRFCDFLETHPSFFLHLAMAFFLFACISGLLHVTFELPLKV
ncbi:hypothetical protein KP509_31G041800 [Ceratopteris richardii]|uniref:Uncharacterized protein n=1 Tax=Ceratopteris richardii TaxID=49495 RepID=A0A8T2QXM4_CERRI|nr:hypothetical protein KP509_31G041800 [Ceratopteris richardii]